MSRNIKSEEMTVKRMSKKIKDKGGRTASSADAKITNSQSVDEEDVREAVRRRYSKLATSDSSSCCGPTQETMCSCGTIYPQAEIVNLPEEAVAVSAGCGNPMVIA